MDDWERLKHLASVILDDARAINRIIYAPDPRSDDLPHGNVPRLQRNITELNAILERIRKGNK